MFRTTFLRVVCCLVVCATPAVASQPLYDDWPQLLHDSSHSSSSTDTKLTAANATTLGIKWMVPMRSADLGSPVVAFNRTLNKTIAYVGDERGDVLAFNAADGASIWSTSVGVGNSERASPLVAPDGSVWVATAGTSPAQIIKLDGATGNVDCSLAAPIHINSSLLLATPPGGVETIYTATNHTAMTSGTEIALNESNCAQQWTFDGWLTLSGAWATPVFGVDANGKGRVIVGTADPDSTMYALDALTGTQVWNYSALNPPDGEFDIGAAATVSPPGNNGFADGVLYFPSKYGIMYALDLTTGKPIWKYNFNKNANVTEGGRSAAALHTTSLVFGMANGVEAVNAVTGKLIWHYVDPSGQEVLSSPAITGPPGAEVVVFADVTGLVTVLRLSDGTVLYNYKTGNFVTSSPAIVNGSILIASSDGYLYDLAASGSNALPPTTSIATPATGTNLPNPGSTVTVSGSASETGSASVAAIQIAVQRGGSNGPWLDASTGTWVSGAVDNVVPVANPGQVKSSWSFSFPVLPSGSSYQVTANAVAAGGQADRVGAQTKFTVKPSSQNPALTVSSKLDAPGSTFVVSGGPFAPNETVDFSLQAGPIKKATANASGTIVHFPITVPALASFGLTTLTAVGETSQKASSASIDIANIWTQSGYDASHTGFEPHDTVLGTTLQSTSEGYLSEAWTFDTGAAIDTSPIVVGGTAYVANSAGTLDAVDTFAGAPLWTASIPTKAPIEGAPAIGDGDVVLGAEDGSLYRFSAANGAPIGTIALDGVPTSPTLAGGTIYTGTDNGTVFALSESTGSEIWSTAVGQPVAESPAVDSANGLVFVGDVGGHITELDATTGAVVAVLTTGGAAITVPPEISGGLLLVGAADGYLRAFHETTGKLAWKYNAGSPIDSLASTGDTVYAGSDSGAITKLIEAKGTLVYQTLDDGSAVIGIGHTDGVSITATKAGHINALKDSQNGRIQFNFATGKGLDTQPVIVDGTVYVGAEDGRLYAFTNHGQAPDAIEHRALAQLRALAPAPSSWTNPRISSHAIDTTEAFAPHGPRAFPMHVDRAQPSPSQRFPLPSAGQPRTRTYLIGWAPVAVRAAAFVTRARAVSGAVAGTSVDTTPYPRVLDDGAIQREVAKAIAVNGWHPGVGSRFVVVTAGSPVSAREYCSYHSAFDLNGSVAEPVVYGVIPAGTSEECGPFGPQIQRETNELNADPYVRIRSQSLRVP